MAKGFIFSLCLLLVVNGCLAARQGRTSQQNQCQLNHLQAREPDNRIDAEAGQIETWNYNEDDFQCAGVAASRITIEQNGLHLPSYANAPQLIYVVQGRGLLGTVLSGCPETYEESQEDQSQQQYQRGGRGKREQQEEQEERQREQERRSRQEQQQQQGGRRERQEEQEERQKEQERRRRQEQQQQQGGRREQQEEQEERQEERQREQERRRRQQQQQGGQRGKEEQLDRHQKVRRIREGDVIAIPAGVAYWSYNDGQENLVAVSLLDLSNNNNQLDQNPRRFYLAGNPEDEFEQQGRSQQYRRQRGQSGQRGQRQQEEEEERRGEQQESRREREKEQEQERRQEQQSRRSRRGQQQQGNGNNVFSGFSTRLLAQALNVDEETAKNLQGQDDNRNQIVRVKGKLDLVQPPRGQQQRQHEQRQEEQLERERQRAQQGGRNDLVMANGIEETLCSARLKENLQNPERADIYTPQAGRVSTLNSHNLPILRLLRLSAERGFFYNNAIYSPHWNLNAHSVVYVLRGDARVQVVNDNGDLILDDQVQEGQLFIVPQNHAVLKQAGNRGFEYIAFKTEDNAMINTLVGRTSVLRALPQEVVANAYQVSRQEAMQLKYNRQETAALSSQQQGSSYERRAIA